MENTIKTGWILVVYLILMFYLIKVLISLCMPI